MASLGEIDKHGREQTGLKATKRIVEKAALRPGEGRGRTERVCDVVRAMLVAKDMRTVGAIAEALRALQAAGLVEVRRIKDRFAQPSGGGWRDLMVNLVVLGNDGGVRHVLFLQDDVFSVAGQASFEALHAYATAGDFELLSVELTPQEVDVAGCGRVFETDELTVYAASSEDYRRSGVWAMDDGPFLARIDFLLDRLYDERYFSMPDVWSAEAYLKEKIEQDPVPRFLTDVRFYWRANLLGRNADRRRGYRFLQARFPDAAPEVQRSLSRLARS